MRSRDLIVITIPFILTATSSFITWDIHFSHSLFFNPKLQCPTQWIPALTLVIWELNRDFPDRVYCSRMFCFCGQNCLLHNNRPKQNGCFKQKGTKSEHNRCDIFFSCFDHRYTFWPVKMKRSWQLKDENEKLNGWWTNLAFVCFM